MAPGLLVTRGGPPASAGPAPGWDQDTETAGGRELRGGWGRSSRCSQGRDRCPAPAAPSTMLLGPGMEAAQGSRVLLGAPVSCEPRGTRLHVPGGRSLAWSLWGPLTPSCGSLGGLPPASPGLPQAARRGPHHRALGNELSSDLFLPALLTCASSSSQFFFFLELSFKLLLLPTRPPLPDFSKAEKEPVAISFSTE